MGLDTKTYWLTDRQSQCDFDFDVDFDSIQRAEEQRTQQADAKNFILWGVSNL
jgi:hypothetical protein